MSTDIEAINNTAANNIFAAFTKGIRNYFKFSGRTCRYDYWGYTVVQALIYLLCNVAESIIPQLWTLYMVVSLLLLIPAIAIFARRLHDVNKSFIKWFVIPFIIFLVGGLVVVPITSVSIHLGFIFFVFAVAGLVWVILLFVDTCRKGNAESNKYGEPIIEGEGYDRKFIVLLLSCFIIGAISSEIYIKSHPQVDPTIENEVTYNLNHPFAEENVDSEQAAEPIQNEEDKVQEEAVEAVETESEAVQNEEDEVEEAVEAAEAESDE